MFYVFIVYILFIECLFSISLCDFRVTRGAEFAPFRVLSVRFADINNSLAVFLSQVTYRVSHLASSV